MALAKDELLKLLTDWGIAHETIGHALSPTCDVHSESLRGTAFAKYVGRGQAKNLFFKVPSAGGPLKNRLFLVCALVETAVDNKALSARLGVKPSAPLRLGDAELMYSVLGLPRGSVNPFAMAQPSCSGVTLLLDSKFLQCERLLFHPMQCDFSTALAPDQLDAFLDRVAPSRYAYVDFDSGDPVALPGGDGPKSPPGAPPGAPRESAAKPGAPGAEGASWWAPPWPERCSLAANQRWLRSCGL